jgi:maltose alpha-D-glucosyltransferase/alpha-amylase
MRLSQTADVWWKNAVIYCLDVETFQDSDGDGHGDFHGLAQRVDYLSELGVTCVWLMPFFPTAERDDGYDIIDFYGVDPRLGTPGDLVEFLRLARDRGIRVICDLVVNHTSDQHPWFRSARSSRDSAYRDWYVWRDEPPEDGPKAEVVFPDQEKSLWEYDEQAGQYFLHHFYRHQPDLNVTNPAVRDEIVRVVGYWLALGMSGFRVDAVPFLLETAGSLTAEDLPDPHGFLRDMRDFLSRRDGEAVLLGEVNLPYPDTERFFGNADGDELTMCFDFIGMQRLYLSLARRRAAPLAEAMRARPAAPKDAQWTTFVRNHDELTLDKLSDDERQEVFAAFGPEPEMQVYGRGLRRRLPPMLDGDPARVRMVYSLLLSLPGTPTLFYGEEIGMGENLRVEGRSAVRTPMQWSADATGGFSTADADKLPAPVTTGRYGPAKVNVAGQRRDPDSLLSWMTLLIRRYRQCPELAWGATTVLEHDVPAVLAHRADYDGGTVVALHNLDADPVEVSLRIDGVPPDAHLVDLFTDGNATVGADCRVRLPLDGYGCRWLRVVGAGGGPATLAAVQP